MEGLRPKEPENASAIGFSDLLWDFVQRCWHENMELRPQVADLVAHLWQVAREWNRPMPPHIEVQRVTSTSQDSMSGLSERCKLEGLIFPWYCLLMDGTALFNSSAISKHPTELKGISVPFIRLSTPSAQSTESLQEGPQHAVSTKQKEVLHYPHLEENFQPPPAKLPQRKMGRISKHLLPMFTQKKRNITVSSPSSKGSQASRCGSGQCPGNVMGRISNSLAGLYSHKNLCHHLSQASLLNQKGNKPAGVALVNIQAMSWVESLIILQAFTFTKISTIIPPRHHC